MSRIVLSMTVILALGCGPSEADHQLAADNRPLPAPAHDDEGQHHGRVAFSREQVEAADIRTAVAGPGVIQRMLELPAVVDVNLDAQAHVNPRVGGLVSAIHAQLGQAVQRGDPLCEIDSVDLGRAVGAYLTAQATVDTSAEILVRERELLSHNLELAREIFDRERDLAEREITTLSARYEAERALQDAQLRQDSRLLELEARLGRERIELVAAERELELLGLDHEDVARIATKANEPHEPFGTYMIRSPRIGVIVVRDITENEFVDSQTSLFEIQDLTHVWVLASVYEQDLASVRMGAPAGVRLDAFPGVDFHGEVSLIAYRIDPATRTAAVRIELDNEPIEAWPEAFPIRPGMYGRAEITTGLHEADVVVPESALVHDPEGDFVFVRHGPGLFERRAVRAGAAAHERVEIIEGLRAGDDVVVSGAFQLKSALRKGELGEGHGH